MTVDLDALLARLQSEYDAGAEVIDCTADEAEALRLHWEVLVPLDSRPSPTAIAEYRRMGIEHPWVTDHQLKGGFRILTFLGVPIRSPRERVDS